MIIFLYGPDDYRRTRKKKEVVAEFRKRRSDLGFDLFDLAAAGEFDRFREFLRSQSIFESSKLAVLENAFEIDPPKLAKVLKPLAEEKGLQVLIAGKEKPVKALAFLLEKPVLTQKFENLTGPEWLAFIKEEAKRRGMSLAAPAVQFLGAVYEGNSWGLITELQKLSALQAAVAKKDLDALDLEESPNYWALVNGLKSYDLRARVYALERLLSINDPPPKIFNILAAQGGEKLPRMAEYDLAVKSGKLDYEEALVDLVLS